MSDFLKSCVARYQELAGPKGANLRKATTPYVDEAMDYDVYATPAGGQPPPSGELGAIASKVLMKVLYAARIARFEPTCFGRSVSWLGESQNGTRIAIERFIN